MSHDDAHHRWSSPGAYRVTIVATYSWYSIAVASLLVPEIGGTVRGTRSSHVWLPSIGVAVVDRRVAVVVVGARSITIWASGGGIMLNQLPRLMVGWRSWRVTSKASHSGVSTIGPVLLLSVGVVALHWPKRPRGLAALVKLSIASPLNRSLVSWVLPRGSGRSQGGIFWSEMTVWRIVPGRAVDVIETSSVSNPLDISKISSVPTLCSQLIVFRDRKARLHQTLLNT